MSRFFDEPARPSTPKPTPTSSFDGVIREIHAQNVCIQLLEQQRENMTQILLQANTQLAEVQKQAQEADQ